MRAIAFAQEDPPTPSLSIDGPVNISSQASDGGGYAVTVSWHVAHVDPPGSSPLVHTLHVRSFDPTSSTGSDWMTLAAMEDGNGNVTAEFSAGAGADYSCWVESSGNGLTAQNDNNGNYYHFYQMPPPPPPPPPPALSLANVSWSLRPGDASGAEISWDASGGNAHRVHFYGANDPPQNWSDNGGRVTVSVSGLEPSQTYQFWVESNDSFTGAHGQSDNGGAGYPLTTPPTVAISGVTATRGEDGTSAVITWTAHKPYGTLGGWHRVLGDFNAAVPASAGQEETVSVTVTLTRSDGAGGAVSVDWSADGGGAAIPGQHFYPASGTVSFEPGQSSASFTVEVYATGELGDKTLALNLSNATGGATLGAQATGTLTIRETESGVGSIGDPSVTALENRRAVITWPVMLNAPANQIAHRVFYSADGGSTWTAAEGAESNGQVTATLENLEPGTAYVYYVQSGCGSHWASAPSAGFANFTTTARLTLERSVETTYTAFGPANVVTLTWKVWPASPGAHTHTVWQGGSPVATGTEDSEGNVTATLTVSAGHWLEGLWVQTSADGEEVHDDNGGNHYRVDGPPVVRLGDARVDAVNETSATVSWAVTAYAPLASHEVSYSDERGAQTVATAYDAGTGRVTAQLTNLLSGRDYTCTVSSYANCDPNALGAAASQSVAFTTATISPPPPPPPYLTLDHATAAAVACDRATVSWEVSSGSGWFHYTVLYGTESDALTQSRTGSGDTSTTLSGLQPNQTYYCQIVAETWDNDLNLYSASSGLFSFTTPAPIHISGAPTATPLQSGGVAIRWQVANSSGQSATHRVSVLAADGVEVAGGQTQSGESAVSIQVDGLLPGSTYRYVVTSKLNDEPGWSHTVGGDGTPLTFTTLLAISNVAVNPDLAWIEGDTIHVCVNWRVQPAGATSSHAVFRNAGMWVAPGSEAGDGSGWVTAFLPLGRGDRWPVWVQSGAATANQDTPIIVEGLPLVTISNLLVTPLTPTTALVSWNADGHGAALSNVVSFRTGGNALATVAADSAGVVAVATLTNLAANALYEFFALADSGRDATSTAGALASLYSNFVSKAWVRITDAPTRGGVDAATRSTTLNWGIENNSGEAVNNTVSYTWTGPAGSGSGTAYSVTEPGQSIANVTISNLVAGATYNFSANSTVAGMGADSASTQSSGGTFTITTNELPLPSSLVIFNVSANPDLITDTMALVTWNVAYASTNDYGMASHFVLVSSNAPPTALEQMVFAQGQEDESGNVWAVLSGLSPGQTNYFAVESVLDSSSGRFAVDNNGGLYYSFTNTVGGDVPTDPLAETIAIIQPPIAGFVSDTMAIISWQVTPTDWAYPSHFVIYGTNNPPTLMDALIAPAYQADANNVAAVLAPLQPGCNYWFSVQSVIDFTEGRFATDNGCGLYYPFTTLSAGGQPVHGDYSSLHDGIPDWWKLQYGFGIFDPYVADDDPDGDGFSNLEEYLDGTNPLDPASHRLVIQPPPPVIVSFTQDRFDDITPATSVTVELERDNTERAVSVNLYYMDSDPPVFCGGVTFQPGQQKASVVVSPRVSTDDGGAFSTLVLTATEASPEVQFSRSMAFVEVVAPRYWVSGGTYSDPNATTAWVTVSRNETNDTCTVDILYAADETSTAGTASFSPGDSQVRVPIILRSDLMEYPYPGTPDNSYLTIKLAPPWESSADIVYYAPPQVLPAPYVELRITSEKVDGPDFNGRPGYFIVPPGDVVLEAKVYDYDQDNQPVEVTDYAQFDWGSGNFADGPTITTNIVESTAVGVTARNWRAVAPFQFAPLSADSDEAGASVRLEVPMVALHMPDEEELAVDETGACIADSALNSGQTISMTMTNAYVLINSDDDNGSRQGGKGYIPPMRDFQFEGSLAGKVDSELAHLSLDVRPINGPLDGSGEVKLTIQETGRDRIKIWKGNQKGLRNLLYPTLFQNTPDANTITWHLDPQTNAIPDLYVEGIKEGDSLGKIKLVCEYLIGGQLRSRSQLNLTVTPVLTNLKVTVVGGPPRLDDQCKKFYSNAPGAFDTSTSPTVRMDAAVKVDEQLNSGKLEILQLVRNDGLLADGAALKDSFGQKYAFMYPYQGQYLVDATNGTDSIRYPFLQNAYKDKASIFYNTDAPFVVLPRDIVDVTRPASIAISESFTDYAVWLQDGTAYFLGSTSWQVNFMADMTATADVLGHPVYHYNYYDCNGVSAAPGFRLGNSNQNMDTQYANKHAKDYGAWQQMPVRWYKRWYDKIVWGF